MIELPLPDFKFRAINPWHSHQAQLMMFAMGYSWHTSGQEVKYTEYEYLFGYRTTKLKFTNVSEGFNEKELPKAIFPLVHMTTEDIKEAIEKGIIVFDLHHFFTTGECLVYRPHTNEYRINDPDSLIKGRKYYIKNQAGVVSEAIVVTECTTQYPIVEYVDESMDGVKFASRTQIQSGELLIFPSRESAQRDDTGQPLYYANKTFKTS